MLDGAVVGDFKDSLADRCPAPARKAWPRRAGLFEYVHRSLRVEDADTIERVEAVLPAQLEQDVGGSRQTGS